MMIFYGNSKTADFNGRITIKVFLVRKLFFEIVIYMYIRVYIE